jgi:hypothetical protein
VEKLTDMTERFEWPTDADAQPTDEPIAAADGEAANPTENAPQEALSDA